MKLTKLATAFCAVGVVVFTGCSTPDTTTGGTVVTTSDPSATAVAPDDYRYPVDVAGPYNVVWDAAVDIDLHSRAAELARGYIESCQLSIFGRAVAYPGAAAAAPATSPENAVSCLYAPKSTDYTAKPAFYGTMYATILELTRTGNQISARGCYTTNGRAEVETHEPDRDTLSALEFTFTARLPDGSIDPREDVNRVATSGTGTRAPQFDVFYPWKFDAVRRKGLTVQPPLIEVPCAQWAATKLDQVPAYSGQIPFTPDGFAAELTPKLFGGQGFPTLPQTPAWPAP